MLLAYPNNNPLCDRFGEAPRAYIVLKPDCESTEEDIHAYMKENAAPYKQLVGGIKIMEAIPKSTAGKILRKELVAQYKKENNIS